MDKCNFTPYEGNDPYIFVSYAHKDSYRVYPIIDELASRGYRVWYDDGIAPGSEWPEYIAEHLNGSAVVMAFISSNSIASSNCRREVTFALSKKKEFLAVMLEETEMSLGMEMQLSAQQCVMKHECITDGEFYDKLCNAPGLAVCNCFSGESRPKAGSEGSKSSFTKGNSITDEDMKTVAHMENWVEKQEEKEKKAVSEKNRKKSKAPGILLTILGAFIALIVGGVIINRATSVRLPNEQSIGRNEGIILVRDTTISASNLKKIGKMKKLYSITFKNCEIQGDLGTLDNLGRIRYLDIEGSTLNDYEFLGKMNELITLNLCGHENFEDVSVIPTDKLTALYLDGTGVKDIRTICKCTSLVKLSLANTQVSAISEPFNSLRLTELNLAGLSELKDLSAFEGLTLLEYLNVSDSAATCIPWLGANSDKLKTLVISGTNLDEATLEAIGQCDQLDVLGMNEVPADNLSFLYGNVNLTELYASGCGLTDATAVEGLTNLKYLWLDKNRLSEINLSNLSDLREINLAHNRITALSKLPVIATGTLYMAVYDNPVDIDTMPLSGISTGILMTDYSDSLLDKDRLGGVSKLYVIGTPLNKQVEMEDTYKYSIIMTSANELDKKISESGSLNSANWAE